MRTPEAGDVFERSSNKAWVMITTPHAYTKDAYGAHGRNPFDFLLVRLTKNRYSSHKTTEVRWGTADYYTVDGIQKTEETGYIKFLFNIGDIMESLKQRGLDGH
jgi:hypothetical protein